jgi:hypothetical protein
MLGQGKDIIVAFTENQSHIGFFSFNYTRLIFFLAIGFWIYVSWYSSRIISYIKKSKQEDKVQEIAGVDRDAAEKAFKAHKNYFEISENFLNEFPRMIGNTCFLIIELAVLQSPILYKPLGPVLAWIILIVALILLRYLNKWITKSQAIKASFRRVFRILLVALVILIIFVSFLPGKVHILILLGLLILFHAVFMYYINLRRVQMEIEANTVRAKSQVKHQQGSRRGFIVRLMDFFCVPRKESGYFKWFLLISLLGIIFYLIGG